MTDTATISPAPAENEVLEKPSPQTRSWRLPAIDGLRAMACMMVFVIHTWEFAEHPALPITFFGCTFDVASVVKSFPAGVDLFMVLSGFCLFWPLCKSEDALQKWSCKEYVWRRIKRICPPYYVAIAYVILLPQLLVVMMRLAHVNFDGHPARWQPNPSAADIVTHMLFIHTATFEYWEGHITGAFWSLGLEAQFYLVFPLVVMQFRRHRVKAIVGMIVLSILFRLLMRWIFTHHYQITDSAEYQDVSRLCNISFLGRWMQFAFGMLAALGVAKYVRIHRLASAWLGTSLVAAALLTYVVILHLSMEGITRDTLMGALFAILVFAVTSTGTFIRHIFELRPVVFIGTISYSIFLIHQTTIWFFSQLVTRKLYGAELPKSGSAPHWILLCTVGLAAVLMVAYPFYLCFEKPFIAAPKKKKPAERTVETAHVAALPVPAPVAAGDA